MAITVVVVGVSEALSAVRFGNPADLAVIAGLAVYGAVVTSARVTLQRGRIRLAVGLFAVSTLAVTLIASRLISDAPALALTPLMVVAVALPYLSGRRLAALMVVAIFTGSLVVALQAYSPVESRAPGWLANSVRVLVFAAASGLVLGLLFRFGRALQHARDDAEARLRQALQAEERYRTLVERVPVGLFRAVGAPEQLLEANPALVRMLGYADRESLLRTPIAQLMAPSGQETRAGSPGDPVSTDPFEVRAKRADGSEMCALVRVGTTLAPNGRPIYDGVVEDITAEREARHAAEEFHLRFTSFFERAAIGMSIVDLDGRYVEVNPALCRMLGYSPEEMRGRSIEEFKHPAERGIDGKAYAEYKHASRPSAYSVERRFIRADGMTLWIRLVGSMVTDVSGSPQFGVGMFEDITELKNAEARLSEAVQERARVAAALKRLQPGGTLEETAAGICKAITSISGVDLAGVYDMTNGRAVPLAVVAPDQAPIKAGKALPKGATRRLRENAMQGPWTRVWDTEARSSYERAWIAAGLRVSAYLPLVVDGQLAGLLVAGSSRDATADATSEWLGTMEEYGTVAAALLGADLVHRAALTKSRAALSAIIQGHEFGSVFQPIVRLEDDGIVGYEALTRFHDGTPPDVHLREATSLGLRLELEEACLATALAEATKLPTRVWLSVNASPGLVKQRSRALRRGSGRLIVEVTEEEAIEDYEAIRRAIGGLGGNVDLAVDDAGAGYASLRHIIELRPRFVKLDIRLVAQIHTDPSRQAMVAGMVHFARETGCDLIAEGVETDQERTMLASLGVRYGQGYLFGRPAPLAVPSPLGARNATGPCGAVVPSHETGR